MSSVLLSRTKLTLIALSFCQRIQGSTFDKATREIPLSFWVALSEEIKEIVLDGSTEE